MGYKIFLTNAIPVNEIEEKTGLKVSHQPNGTWIKSDNASALANTTTFEVEAEPKFITDLTFYGESTHHIGSIMNPLINNFRFKFYDENDLMEQYYNPELTDVDIPEHELDDIKNIEDTQIEEDYPYDLDIPENELDDIKVNDPLYSRRNWGKNPFNFR